MSENPFSPPEDQTPLALASDSSLLADRSVRMGARILDNILAAIGAVPGVLLAIVAPPGQDFVAGIGGTLAVGGYLAVIVYNWWLISTSGQTLGKRASNIRIVKLDGSPPGFVGGVILRNWIVLIATQIPYVGGLVSLVDALMIFGNDRRCMHDHIAGTKVVRA